jgi:hypothetical protein
MPTSELSSVDDVLIGTIELYANFEKQPTL